MRVKNNTNQYKRKKKKEMKEKAKGARKKNSKKQQQPDNFLSSCIMILFLLLTIVSNHQNDKVFFSGLCKKFIRGCQPAINVDTVFPLIKEVTLTISANSSIFTNHFSILCMLNIFLFVHTIISL